MSTLFDKPRWASSGEIVEPSEGKKDLGWVATEKPAHQFFNWLLNSAGAWISNFSGVAAKYTGVDQFISAGEAGDIGTIVPDVGAFVPFAELGASAVVLTGIRSIDGDGQFIYLATDGVSGVAARWDKSPAFVGPNYAPSGTPAVTDVTRVRCNGSRVVVLFEASPDMYVASFDAETGVQLGGVYNAGTLAGDEADIAISNDQIFFCRSGGANVIALDIEDPGAAANWSRVLANANSIESDGVRVYVGTQGAMGGGFDGSSRLASLSAVTGNPEGESVTDDCIPRGLATDGDRLVMVTTSNVELYSANPIVEGGLSNPTHGLIDSAAYGVGTTYLGAIIDKDFVGAFGFTAGQSLISIGKTPSDSAVSYGVIGAGEETRAAYSDGDVVISGNIFNLRVNNRPKPRAFRWYRADPTNDVFMPYRQLAFPLE